MNRSGLGRDPVTIGGRPVAPPTLRSVTHGLVDPGTGLSVAVPAGTAPDDGGIRADARRMPGSGNLRTICSRVALRSGQRRPEVGDSSGDSATPWLGLADAP
jgi:hypothetical protein